MNVSIHSRETIKLLIEKDFPDNVAVISFYSPQTSKTYKELPPVDYCGKCKDIFYVCIYDIDIEVLESYGLTFETYFPEVEALAEFIINAEKKGLNFICQCDYGQSRSAACASAILEYYFHNGISIFADYRYYPNQLIFNKLLKALQDKS